MITEVGLIGCGYWGPNYLRILKELHYQVKWVCDKAPNVVKKFNAERNIKTTTDYNDILTDKEIDCVIVSTPVATHYSIVKEALLSGKHVLVEKPMTATSQEAQELDQLAKQQKVVLMVGHTFLFNDGVRELKKRIEAGEVG